jgi:hypothetical protein
MHLPCSEENLSLIDKKMRLLSDMDSAGIAGGIVIADSTLSNPIGTNEECLKLFDDLGCSKTSVLEQLLTLEKIG